jgi:hypothetical protein
MKKVKESMKEKGASDEEVKEFETGASTFAKKVVGSFKDWEFFTGESMDPDGMVVLLNYREDGTTPYVCVCEFFSLLFFFFILLTITREARSFRDEGLSLSKSRQAGCISGLLSFSNYALSYDIHEPNKSTLTLLTPKLPSLFTLHVIRNVIRIICDPTIKVYQKDYVPLYRHGPSTDMILAYSHRQ